MIGTGQILQGTLNNKPCVTEQPEESEFIKESRNLEHRIADLNELVSILQSRLTPVRYSVPVPVVEPQLKAEVGKAPLGDFLHHQASRIRDINNSLNQLFSELRI